MQIEYISKREVKVPERAPQALSSLLIKTQEGLATGGGLDTVRWLHDSLAYLTEFFASFAVGALQTVGPYSVGIERLLEQPHSLDRSERLLTQAFVDWKAHPHHPAYESLRETFYLTSRLQSSRFAPRRHTRWLGVEGRAVDGLERLTRWSRRIDLVVNGNDEATAKSFLSTYTPILWAWTDAVQGFFQGWLVEVENSIDDGRLSLAGSASKDDVRLSLVPISRIDGLKSLFATDGNGGVALSGFAAAGALAGSTESVEAISAVETEAETTNLGQELPSAEPAAVEPPVLEPPVVETPVAEPVTPAPAPIPSPEVDVPLPTAVPVAEPEAAELPDVPEAAPPLFSTPAEEPSSPAPAELTEPETGFVAPPTPDFINNGEPAPPTVEIGPEELGLAPAGSPGIEAPLFQGASSPSETAPAPAIESLIEPPAPDTPLAEPSQVAAPVSTEAPLFATSTPVPEDIAAPAPPVVAPPVVPEPVLSSPEQPPIVEPAPQETVDIPGLTSAELTSVPATPDIPTNVSIPGLTEPLPETSEPAPPPAVPDLTIPEPTPGVPSFTAPENPLIAPPEPAVETAPAAPEFALPESGSVEAAPDVSLPEPGPEPAELAPAAPPEPAITEFELPDPTQVTAAPVLPDSSAPPSTVPEFVAPVPEPVSTTDSPLPEADVSPTGPDFAAPAPIPEPAPSFTPPESAAVPVAPEVAVPEPEVAVPEPLAAVPEPGVAPVAPEFTPPSSEPNVPVPEPTIPEPLQTAPDFALPEASAPVVPELTAPEPMQAAPDFALPESEPVASPDLALPQAEPSVTAPEVAVPEAIVEQPAQPSPDFTVPEPTPGLDTPQFGLPESQPSPATPDFTFPTADSEQAAPTPTVPEPVASSPVPEPAPVVPDLASPESEPLPTAPDLSGAAPEAAGPDLIPEPVVPGLETTPVAAEPDLSVAPELVAPEPTPAVPDFAAPQMEPISAVPDLSTPVPEPMSAPDFSAPGPVPEPIPAAPDFSAPAPEPEAIPAAPDFSSPAPEPEAMPAAPEPEPPVAELSTPDFAAPEPPPSPDVPDLAAPEVPTAAAVPDFAAPVDSSESDGSAEIAAPLEAATPESAEPVAAVPDFSAAGGTPEAAVPEPTPPAPPAPEPSEASGPDLSTVAAGAAAALGAVAAATNSEEGPQEVTVETPIADLVEQPSPEAASAEVPIVEPTVEIDPTATPPVEPPAAIEPPPAPSAAEDMFAVSDDMFSEPTDDSAPLFPVDTQEAGASSSPYVNPADPAMQSVELDTVANRDMGASAEEILDDGYKFSSTDGPSPPSWKGWSVDQREAVQEVCEFAVGQSESTIPQAYSAPLSQALAGPAPRIQVILEPRCGKTRLAQDLTREESAGGRHLALLASWEKADSDGFSGAELLRFYYELRRSKKIQGGQLILPEPQTVRTLAISADKDGFAQAFQRLVGQIASLNRKALLFVLDEPPEAVRQALSLNYPEGVRFVALTNPNETLEGAATVDLQGKWKASARELFGDEAIQFFDHEGANLFRLALATELVKADLAVPATLQDLEEFVLNSETVSTELIAVLSLEEQPISLDDLDQWFLDADAVTDTITTFPSLFELKKTRLSPVLGLSHPAVEGLIAEKFPNRRANVARKLLGWVVAQLEKTNAEKYGGLQVRDIVFRSFLRLFYFAKLSDDSATLEWVMRNKELQRQRVALSSHFEKPGSRYELQEMLRISVELLGTLVDSGQCDDLRDELAWAMSNLAQNQFQLGLLPQAIDNVSFASELFSKLVDVEKQYEFRPALSTAQYRASRVFDANSDPEAATEYANSAVQGFVDLVEDRGRTELSSRLGIALAHRGSLLRDAEDFEAAKQDLLRAVKLLENLGEDESRESSRTLIDVRLELVSILLRENDFNGAVAESTKAVQLATDAVENRGYEDFQPMLATSHSVRSKSFFKLQDLERAVRDIAKGISLRNLSVDEGRLEQRFHLAKDLQLRAQIEQARGGREDAMRDLARAVEILDVLRSEGRSDALPHLIHVLQDRASVALTAGQGEAGIADLNRALTLVGQQEGGDTASRRLKLSETLLQAYLQQGRLQEALPVSQELLGQYHTAQDWEAFSRVQLIRGEAFERLGQLKQAMESYTQASSLLSQLLAQGQTDERLGRVAEAYLGLSGVEFKLGKNPEALKQAKQAIDVFTHLFQQKGQPQVLPRLLKAYSLFASANTNLGRLADAKHAIKHGFDLLAYLEANGGKGGVPTAQGLEGQKADLYRQRGELVLAEGDPTGAYNDTEDAIRNYLETRTYSNTWKDELARTWVLRSKILYALKDFGQAETSVQDAINHFEEKMREGRYERFPDLMKAMTCRADNAVRSGKLEQVLEEYNKMLSLVTSVAQSGAAIDQDMELLKIFEKRANLYRSQNMLNEAYADYESVIGLVRKLISAGRPELASELVRVHLARGAMTTKAGHAQHALTDLTEAVNIASTLVGQGQMDILGDLADALHQRADVYRAIGRGGESLQDLEGCIGFRAQLLQSAPSPELMGSLGKALLSQATLLLAANQGARAVEALDKANGIFTDLVEAKGYREYSSDLAQGLIQRVSLSSDKSDPNLRQILIKAVNLVTHQAKEGRPVSKDFIIECLRTVVELLQREDFETVGHLIDSVLSLVETVVTDHKSEQDFVKLTDLLLAASAGLIDDRRTARRPHFLSLACVSCNREIQMFGKNSLPRLVYCLYELGQALERSKPPAVLNYIGSSFALLGEFASQQQTNEDFMRELKMMVSTWRSLPPQVPALANVSRHMLSQLLRLT